MPQRDEHPPPHSAQRIIEDLRRDNERLREDLRRSEAEHQRLRRENEKLKDDLEAARRAGYRQAAPFSRGARVATPGATGTESRVRRMDGRGSGDGRRTWMRATRRRSRAVPNCQGAVRRVRVATQYQEELPVKRVVIRCFTSRSATATSAVGACRVAIRCRRRMRLARRRRSWARRWSPGGGPQQAARAVVRQDHDLLSDRCGLTVTRSGLVQAVHRAARQARRRMTRCVRRSAAVPWSVPMKRAGRSTTLAVAVGLRHAGDDGLRDSTGPRLRGSGDVMGADYAGVLVRDGWQPYRQFTAAAHQTCLAIAARCRVLLLEYPAQPSSPRGKRICRRPGNAGSLSRRRPLRSRTRRRARSLPRAARAAPATHAESPPGGPSVSTAPIMNDNFSFLFNQT